MEASTQTISIELNELARKRASEGVRLFIQGSSTSEYVTGPLFVEMVVDGESIDRLRRLAQFVEKEGLRLVEAPFHPEGYDVAGCELEINSWGLLVDKRDFWWRGTPSAEGECRSSYVSISDLVSALGSAESVDPRTSSFQWYGEALFHADDHVYFIDRILEIRPEIEAKQAELDMKSAIQAIVPQGTQSSAPARRRHAL